MFQTFVSSLCKNQHLIKSHSQQPIIFEIFPHFFDGLVLLGFALLLFAYAFCAASISNKVSPDVFWFFNCEKKMVISAKKCVLLKLSLIGCLRAIDSLSCTHPGSSDSTLTDCAFLPQEIYVFSRTVFPIFFPGFLMLSFSVHQHDASQNGK